MPGADYRLWWAQHQAARAVLNRQDTDLLARIATGTVVVVGQYARTHLRIKIRLHPSPAPRLP